MGAYKLSASGSFATSRTQYKSFLTGNAYFEPWAPAPSYDSIATAVGTGASSSVTFSSIPSTYRSLQLRVIVRGTRAFAAEQLYVRLNGDSGSNYAYHYLYGDGSGVAASGATTNVFLVNEFPAANENVNVFSSSIIDILDANSANKNKTMRSLSGYDNNGYVANYAGKSWFGSGLWINTAAITSVTVLSNGNFATGTSIALYGVK